MDDKQLNHEAAEWAESLAALQALSAEVQAGLMALSHNDLEKFEARLAAQQQICESLRASRVLNRETIRNLVAELRQAIRANPQQIVLPENPLPTFAARMKDLAQSNQMYAAFVVRAQKLTQALLALYSSHQGYSREGKSVTADHTWSCEA